MVQTTIDEDQLPEDPGEGRRSGCSACGSGKAVALAADGSEGLDQVQPTTAVRFGFMRYIGGFVHAPDMKFTFRAKVMIQTKRGIELGEQVPLTCHGCEKAVTREEVKRWVEVCGDDSFIFDAGRLLREATAADLAEWCRIQQGCREKQRFAQEIADRHKLPIRVVECECTFGGERIIYYFTAAERIDFRAMVKDLAKEYRTRIEMRQVGARDEARLLADYETCGREVCCKIFLKTLRPISMRMAKLQKATLDPSQVSGRCGRLKCCLRYEQTAYEVLDKRLPRTGVRIRTNEGVGVVVNRHILTQLVQIRAEADQLITVVAEDIIAVGVEESEVMDRTPEPKEKKDQPDRPQPEERRSARVARPRRRKPAAARSDKPPTAGVGDDRSKGEAEAGASPADKESQRPGRRRGRRRRRRRRPNRGQGGPGADAGAPKDG